MRPSLAAPTLRELDSASDPATRYILLRFLAFFFKQRRSLPMSKADSRLRSPMVVQEEPPDRQAAYSLFFFLSPTTTTRMTRTAALAVANCGDRDTWVWPEPWPCTSRKGKQLKFSSDGETHAHETDRDTSRKIERVFSCGAPGDRLPNFSDMLLPGTGTGTGSSWLGSHAGWLDARYST